MTWNSQCSFVFPIINGKDTLHMYMGDRWSFPKQGSAATQVWLPITMNGDEMSIPEFHESWRVDASEKVGRYPVETPMKSIKDIAVLERGNWETNDGTRRSKEQGATLSYSFEGQQIGIKALINNTSGYAKVIIRNSENKEVINTIVDFYSNYECISQNFLSPILEYGRYTLTIEASGVHSKWSDKRKNDYGSTDDFVTIEDVVVYK